MSYRDDCMIRDAVVATMKGFGLSNWWIAQFFGVGYSQIASYATLHARRVFKGRLCPRP